MDKETRLAGRWQRRRLGKGSLGEGVVVQRRPTSIRGTKPGSLWVLGSERRGLHLYRRR